MANIPTIYKITSPSKRVYVGQSLNVNKRFRAYLNSDCERQVRLYKSLLKYGSINHKFEILEECTIDELNNRERFWQDFYNVLGPKGLNSRLTTSKDKSGKITEEHKRKIGIATKGRKASDVSKARMSQSQKLRLIEGGIHGFLGKKHSAETRKKMSLARKGKFFGDRIGKSKKVINIETGEVYPCLRIAAEKTGFNYSTLRSRLQFNTPNTKVKYL